jgi:hypothetical protein
MKLDLGKTMRPGEFGKTTLGLLLRVVTDLPGSRVSVIASRYHTAPRLPSPLLSDNQVANWIRMVAICSAATSAEAGSAGRIAFVRGRVR